MYLNIGCVASREHKIEISDTVFLDINEIKKLCEIRKLYELHIRKLPWETGIEIMNFSKFLEESS
jgi:mannose/fructose/N-acetylgalactosamine-specific phosphotransferase system component IIB